MFWIKWEHKLGERPTTVEGPYGKPEPFTSRQWAEDYLSRTLYNSELWEATITTESP